jgi:hypothetical protein
MIATRNMLLERCYRIVNMLPENNYRKTGLKRSGYRKTLKKSPTLLYWIAVFGKKVTSSIGCYKVLSGRDQLLEMHLSGRYPALRKIACKAYV